jgi:hypothetical protein
MSKPSVHTPEVLPPARKGKSTAVAVVTPADEYAARVVAFEVSAEQHASAAVYCAAAAGAVMIQKKAVAAHGEFLPWLEKLRLPDGRYIQVRTAQNYMRLAEEMAERILSMPNTKRVSYLGKGDTDGKTSVLELLAKLDSSKADELHRSAIAEAVREITSESNLRQLYFDWGICKKPKTLGGARPGPSPDIDKAQVYGAWWAEKISELYGYAVTAKTQVHLKQIQIKEMHGLLVDITAAFKELIQ